MRRLSRLWTLMPLQMVLMMSEGPALFADDTFTPQWRMEVMHLLNWGGYDGYHRIEFAPTSTLISGSSGTGKSTCLDAYTALMMPGNVPFNGASNAGQGQARGPSKRSLISYVRGKTDSVQNRNGEMVDRRLRGVDSDGRPCSTASIVAVTFRRDTGECFTAARLFFVRAAASADSEVSDLRITINDTLDIEKLFEVYRTSVGTQGWQSKLDTAFPGLRRHDGYRKFQTDVQSTLSLGRRGEAEKTLQLLARIQAGQQESTIDTLYKKLVFEKPTTFAAADHALSHYAALADSYTTMQRSYDQCAVLQDIVPRHDRYETALQQRTRLTSLRHRDAGDTPWLLWKSEFENSEYGNALADAEKTKEDVSHDLRRINDAYTELEQKVASLTASIDAAGGDRLDEIIAALGRADSAHEQRLKSETLLHAQLATVGTEPPTPHQQRGHVIATGQSIRVQAYLHRRDGGARR